MTDLQFIKQELAAERDEALRLYDGALAELAEAESKLSRLEREKFNLRFNCESKSKRITDLEAELAETKAKLADECDRHKQTIDRLMGEIKMRNDIIADKDATISTLRESLKPFAKLSGSLSEFWQDQDCLAFVFYYACQTRPASSILIEEVSKAKAAYDASNGGE